MKRPLCANFGEHHAHVQVPREGRFLHRRPFHFRDETPLPLDASRDSLLHETPQRVLREIARPGQSTFPRDLAHGRFGDAERAEHARPAEPARELVVEEQTIAVKPPAAALARDPLLSIFPRASTGSAAAGALSRSTSARFSTSTPSIHSRGDSDR